MLINSFAPKLTLHNRIVIPELVDKVTRPCIIAVMRGSREFCRGVEL